MDLNQLIRDEVAKEVARQLGQPLTVGAMSDDFASPVRFGADPNDPAYKTYRRRLSMVVMAMQIGAMATPMTEDDDLVGVMVEDMMSRAEVYYDAVQRIKEARKAKQAAKS